MKKIVSTHGVKVPNSYTWETKEILYNILNTIKYPCIIKPTDAESKKGIQLIHDRVELKKFLDAHFPDDKSYLLEEFVDGLEFTVLGFISESSFHLVSISDKITTKFPPFIEISHRLPFSRMDFRKEIENICYKIMKAMNMKYCPFVGEFKITESGEIYFIEAMPEVGGEYLADYLIPLHYQYDYFMNYIQLMLGEAIQKNNVQKNENLKTHIFFATPPAGTNKLIKSNNIMNFEDSLIFLSKDLKKQGEILDSAQGNLTRVKVIGIKHWGNLDAKDLDDEINKRLGVQFERVD